RFALRHDTGREDEGYTTLRRVEVLRRYTAFLWDLMRPYVGRRVLEVGSGTGVMTRYLATREEVVASDVDPEYVEFLRRTFADKPNVQVRLLDLAHLGEDGLAPHRFDTVVCANVLEHVADDAASLRAMRALLAPGGRVVLIVPALRALYGTIDVAIGHHRRYSRAETDVKLRAAAAAGPAAARGPAGGGVPRWGRGRARACGGRGGGAPAPPRVAQLTRWAASASRRVGGRRREAAGRGVTGTRAAGRGHHLGSRVLGHARAREPGVPPACRRRAPTRGGRRGGAPSPPRVAHVR